MPAGFEFIRLLDALSDADARLVGVNGLNLGKLRRKGLPVSDGFVVTTSAFEAFARSSGLEKSVAWFAERASIDDAMERDRYARMVEREVAVLEAKMNLIAYLAGASLVGVIPLLVVVLGHL